MVAQSKDLWSLLRSRQHLDPAELTAAIEAQVGADDLDYRTRLLIRDSLNALRAYWGAGRLERWLGSCPQGQKIQAIWDEPFERPGFPSLERRVMETTKPETILQFLRDLGASVSHPLSIYLGGSGALIVRGYLSRKTEDIDLVDEVPKELRTQHKLLGELARRHDLKLTHFQSHHLPTGWEKRVHSAEPFGRLQVFFVDAYDVFLSKLFSRREKDFDDLRFVAPQLDKTTVDRRLRDTTAALRGDAELLKNAEHNWYVLFGESLPS